MKNGESHSSEKLRSVAGTFKASGSITAIECIKSGHINDTYKITYSNGERVINYVLQRINDSVFSDPIKIMENIEAVTKHIKKKYENFGWDVETVMFPLRTMDDTTYYQDSEGSYWRMYSYIKGGICYDSAPNTAVVRSVGRAFGLFQMLLSDFPASELKITIPDFHNTVKRFDDLANAAHRAKDNPVLKPRVSNAANLLFFLTSYRKLAFTLEVAKKAGILPLRVTHNDTKCNNVMLDENTNESLAVIDLDTVMPGLCAHDFGDAIRSVANNAAEDERDFSKVYLDLEKFEAFSEGFIPALDHNITETEYKTLAVGAPVIALELSARFATDYLNGDLYFKTNYPEHNLDRARSQMVLAVDMMKKLDKMEQIVKKLH